MLALLCSAATCSPCASMQAVAHLTQLTLLELGANRIQNLQPLQGLTNLQELWLGDNHISSLEWLTSYALPMPGRCAAVEPVWCSASTHGPSI